MFNIEKTLASTPAVYILAGEGETGTWKLFTGKRTMRAINRTLNNERCDGDRWAKVFIDTGKTSAAGQRVLAEICQVEDEYYLENMCDPDLEHLHKENRGGARPGSGQKKRLKGKITPVSMRLDEEEYTLLKRAKEQYALETNKEAVLLGLRGLLEQSTETPNNN